MTESEKKLIARRRQFQRALGKWFDQSQRILPWRTERTVYRTVVSELMLQQTQVATVIPYFERWMRELPDFAALAAASEETILKLWEGLGYYRRARFLHRLAKEIVENGRQPESAAEWRKLPGIGGYTSAAVASISHGEPIACVDGNVVRILARLTYARDEFPNGSTAVTRFASLAGELLDERTPGRHNEAMMEFGATICTKRNPACTICPCLKFCAGRDHLDIESIPRMVRPKTEKREVSRAWVRRNGQLLLHRIPNGSARMEGLFELPEVSLLGIDPRSLRRKSLVATRKRSITRFQITERIHALDRVETSAKSLKWVPIDELGNLAFSGPHRRWVDELLASD